MQEKNVFFCHCFDMFRKNVQNCKKNHLTLAYIKKMLYFCARFVNLI